MSGKHDLLVIGAGANGLTLATLAAKRGLKVLVLEQREQAGGLAASVEFHPGYKSAGLFHDSTGIRKGIIEELDLARHGLQLRGERPSVLALDAGSGGLLIHGNVQDAAREIQSHSAADAARYPEYFGFLDKIRGVLGDFLNRPPLDLIEIESASPWELARRGLKLRRLGARAMMEILRLPPMCLGDWLDEWFENGALKAAMALPALSSTFLGPRSPASTMNMLLWEIAAGGGIQGGGPALIKALEGAAGQAGVQIRTGVHVDRILVGAKGTEGIKLRNGEELNCSRVAASCDPKSLVDKLLPKGAASLLLQERIHSYRSRGSVSQLLLAVRGPVRFMCRGDVAIEFARTGKDLMDLERSFDAIKYRKFSEVPVLDIHVPTVTTPGLSPEGHSVVSVLIHFTPRELEAGWNDESRRRLQSSVMAILERHVPGLSDSVVGSSLSTPEDLERDYSLAGGHLHHGEHALDQLLIRPVPELAGYRSPVPGLFLCGSGSHPGGGLTCAPGMLAAPVVLAAGGR
jgi:phytoene dehydrogenase-like protein